MKYSAQMDFKPDAEIDFSSVESTLLPHGFRLIKKDDTSIAFTGRGLNSTNEDPIRGATHISLIAQSGTLYLNAKLGGVRFMSLFVCLFPPLLMLVLEYFNSSDFGTINYFWGWLVIAPIIVYWLRRRTVNALTVMLENTIAYQPKK